MKLCMSWYVAINKLQSLYLLLYCQTRTMTLVLLSLYERKAHQLSSISHYIKKYLLIEKNVVMRIHTSRNMSQVLFEFVFVYHNTKKIVLCIFNYHESKQPIDCTCYINRKSRKSHVVIRYRKSNTKRSAIQTMASLYFRCKLKVVNFSFEENKVHEMNKEPSNVRFDKTHNSQ